MSVRRLIVAILATATAVLGLTAPAHAATVKEFPFCSWWLETTATSMNVAFPDTSATYWTTPYIAEPGMKIRVDGEYPDTRFMSFTVYDNTFGYFTNNGVESQLTDYQINPLLGAQNPWVTANAPTGGGYSITLQPTVNTSESNVLPILPAAPTANNGLPANMGFLVMRVYLPTGGPQSVALPNLTIENADGSTTSLSKCSKPDRKKVMKSHYGVKLAKAIKKIKNGPAPAPCGTTCPPDYEFFRATASTTGAFFPNAANAYLSMLFTPAKKQVVVIKLLAPTSPYQAGGTGTVPVPWPNNAYQLRYWSVCNNVYASPYPVVANPKGKKGVTYGCVADNEAVRNADGTVTVAISKPAFRPKNATKALGVNWLPTSVEYPKAMEMVALRNMLTNNFTNSALSAPQDASPAGAEAAMGAYYPSVWVCTKAQFESSGTAGCVQQ